MSEAPDRLRAMSGSDAAADDDFEFADYCARPMCRQEFRQSAGRGRRRDYCSETCRRLADRDYKRAKALVEHFERLARRSRHDVLAFGRVADESERSTVSDEVLLQRAASAVDRARAVLRFASDADPRLVSELEALCDAVGPALDRAQSD